MLIVRNYIKISKKYLVGIHHEESQKYNVSCLWFIELKVPNGKKERKKLNRLLLTHTATCDSMAVYYCAKRQIITRERQRGQEQSPEVLQNSHQKILMQC